MASRSGPSIPNDQSVPGPGSGENIEIGKTQRLEKTQRSEENAEIGENTETGEIFIRKNKNCLDLSDKIIKRALSTIVHESFSLSLK